MSWLRPWRVLAVVVAASIAVPIDAAIQRSEAAAQVWKPRSKQRPRAGSKAIKARPSGKAEAKSPPKKSRKASSKAKASRTKAPAKKKPKKARRAPRADDDFTIIEEDFSD